MAEQIGVALATMLVLTDTASPVSSLNTSRVFRSVVPCSLLPSFARCAVWVCGELPGLVTGSEMHLTRAMWAYDASGWSHGSDQKPGRAPPTAVAISVQPRYSLGAGNIVQDSYVLNEV